MVPQPHRHFYADVIKRVWQSILMVDHLTSLVSAVIIPSEKAEDLKAGMIALSTPVRHPGPITIVTDCAPGFISLSKQDKDLKDLHITIILKDQLNKNFNAVVDRACQDIKAELRKLSPEGRRISSSILARATVAANPY